MGKTTITCIAAATLTANRLNLFAFFPPSRFDEELRLATIKKSLEKTLRESDDDHQSNAEFDYTLAAVCEIPRHINLSDWFGQKTWNIFFKPNYRQYNVKSVFLRYTSACNNKNNLHDTDSSPHRLFKVAAQGSKASKECDPDVGEFYKLTVSVYSRKRSNYLRQFYPLVKF